MTSLLTALLVAVAVVDGSVRVGLWREPSPQLIRRTLAVGEISLENKMSYYQTVLLVGNPPQELVVQIDTGSSDLWMMSNENPYCQRSNVQCVPEAMYDHQASSTFHHNITQQEFSIMYGDWTFARGIYAQDDIQIGGIEFIQSQKKEGVIKSNDCFPTLDIEGQWVTNSAAKTSFSASENNEPPSHINIRGANFALATRANSTEAVWGIGLEAAESMAHSITSEGTIFPTYPNLPVQMKEQGYIKTIAYSLWLNDRNSASGTLLFGAVDRSKYVGQLRTVPLLGGKRGVKAPTDFSVALHGIGVYNSWGETAGVVQCSLSVLLDSGTTFTQLPLNLIHPIADTLGAEFLKKNGVYVMNSTQKELIGNGGLKFNFSGAEIDVAIDDLLVPLGGLEKLPEGTVFGDQKVAVTNEFLTTESNDTEFDRELVSLNTTTARAHVNVNKPSDIYYLLGILPIEYSIGGGAILGDTFLRSAYVVYDLENCVIGLANTHFNVEDSQIEEIDSQNGIPNAVPAEYHSATQLSDEIVTLDVPPLFRTPSRLPASVSTDRLANYSTATEHTTALYSLVASNINAAYPIISHRETRRNAAIRPVWRLSILVWAISFSVLA